MEEVTKEIFRMYRVLAERKLERQEQLAKQIQSMPMPTINIFPSVEGNAQSYHGSIMFKMGKAKLRHKYAIRFKPVGGVC
jgi:hypothetical protein